MFRVLLALLLLTGLTACSSMETSRGKGGGGLGEYKVGNPYQVNGKTYVPREDYSYDETGLASWYGPDFHGNRTANGEQFDSTELTAAHRTLPMPSLVRVTNLENGKSIVVRINDRGPFAKGRIIDVSERSAELLGFKAAGVAKVRVAILEPESRALAEGVRKRGGRIAVASNDVVQPEPVAPESTDNADTGDSSADMSGTVMPVPEDAGNVEAPQTAKIEAVEAAPLEAPPMPAPTGATKKAGEAKLGKLPSIPPREPMLKTVEGVRKDGRFYPAPKVEQGKAEPDSKIYVQAGAFTNKDNAVRLQAKLAKLAPTTITQAVVNGTQFYRVRLGPMASAEEADKILDKVLGQDKKAKITVE